MNRCSPFSNSRLTLCLLGTLLLSFCRVEELSSANEIYRSNSAEETPSIADTHASLSAQESSLHEVSPTQAIRSWTDTFVDSPRSGKRRVELAHKNKSAEVQNLFADAGLSFPPKQLLFRVFKQERELEVWAADTHQAPLTQVVSYQICATSGTLGPKKREGDGQVPEGFYQLDYFNANSAFHLSMRINYPNRYDRKRGYTGSAIMIHGNCVSIGCLAMSDERIEELWVMASAVKAANKPIHVHIFPKREMKTLLEKTQNPQLKQFWNNLYQGLGRFNQDHRLFKTTLDRQGNYLFQ